MKRVRLNFVLVLEVVSLTSILFVQPGYTHPDNTTKLTLKAGIGVSALFHSFGASHFSHKSVAKRQTDSENERFCSLKHVEVECSSGFNRAVVDASLNCGDLEQARKYAIYCAQNRRGDFCTTVYYKLTHYDSDLSIIDSYCSGVASSSSCPLNCRQQLQHLKEKLGCCPVSYLSDYQESTRRRSAFDYSVWNQCGVPLPTPCEIPRLSAVEHRCTEDSGEFYYQFYTQRICLRGGAGQAYINGLLSIAERCSDYSQVATFLVVSCASNARGEQCGLLDRQGPLRVNLIDIHSQCLSNSPHCSQACASSIIAAKHSIGCCVNLYNRSDTGFRHALSYYLWNSCGVESPGVCESTLSLNGSKSMMRAVSITVAIFAALMVFILTV